MDTDPRRQPISDRLAAVPDPRALRGRRHRLVVILVLAACVTLVVGNDSVAAIWQWATGAGQEVLARIGARYDALTGRYVVPSERTFRRVLTKLDGDALDAAVSGYLVDVMRGVSPAPVLPAAAGPVEREQRRAATRAVTYPVPAGLLPAASIDVSASATSPGRHRGARTDPARQGTSIRRILMSAGRARRGVGNNTCRFSDSAWVWWFQEAPRPRRFTRHAAAGGSGVAAGRLAR
nr:transposase family protein [Micromonospora tarapacensis]